MSEGFQAMVDANEFWSKPGQAWTYSRLNVLAEMELVLELHFPSRLYSRQEKGMVDLFAADRHLVSLSQDCWKAAKGVKTDWR